MVKKRRDALAVTKSDFLVQIDPCHHLRDDFRWNAERRQRSLKIYAPTPGDDLARPIGMFRKLEIQLLLPVEEEACMAFILLSLLRY